MKGSTLIALAVLVVIGISALVASVFLKQKFTFFPKAQQSTTWSWDEAANQCPNKGSDLAPCICRQLQSEGICTPVGSVNENGLVCITNKWDNSWGCWGSPDQANVSDTTDSSFETGDSCGTIQSQYGTCPDWASENSCHQRLDPPDDPDYGKWFKCVNRWWNGPCDSQEACDGTAALPAEDTTTAVDTSTETQAGPVDTSGLSSCYNYTSQNNCEAKCQLNNADDWYCNKTIDGKGDTSGKYCCFPELSDRVMTPRKLGGNCMPYNPGDPGCDAPFICEDSICVDSTIPNPATETGTPIPIPTQAFIAEGTCDASGTSIGFGSCSYFEQSGSQDCSNSTPIYNSNGCVIYRVCGGQNCKYNCYENGNNKNCLGADDPQTGYDYIHIVNSLPNDKVIGKIIIEKQRLGGNPIKELGGITLTSGDSYSINLNGIGFTCDAISFNSMKVYLFNPDGSLLASGSDGCWGGVNILINLTL